jgi:AcrR family transcriptional regulator
VSRLAQPSLSARRIYRRFSDKAGLVAHVISRQLPVLAPPDLGDSRAELRRAVEQGLPADGRGIDPEAALELMAGPFLARVFAGLDTGPRWRKAAFETWWEILRERQAE